MICKKCNTEFGDQWNDCPHCETEIPLEKRTAINIYGFLIGIAFLVIAFAGFDWNQFDNSYVPYTDGEIVATFLGARLIYWMPGLYIVFFSFPKSLFRSILIFSLTAFLIFAIVMMVSATK